MICCIQGKPTAKRKKVEKVEVEEEQGAEEEEEEEEEDFDEGTPPPSDNSEDEVLAFLVLYCKMEEFLTLYSVDIHFDTSTTDSCRKHCGKRRNCL